MRPVGGALLIQSAPQTCRAETGRRSAPGNDQGNPMRKWKFDPRLSRGAREALGVLAWLCVAAMALGLLLTLVDMA